VGAIRRHGFTLCALALLLALCGRARAHGDLHEQIQALSAQLRADGGDAVLFHKRGELYRAHRDYSAALADYARAERLDPGLAVVQLSRGRALLELGRPARARAALSAFLRGDPDHAQALLLRARCQARLGAHAAAERDFERALDVMADPLPDLFLERAENLRVSGRPEPALAVLELGIQRLGALVTLENAALELELQLATFDAALARIDALLAQAPRPEQLLARRAEVLQRAGRSQEACTARGQALAALAQLPTSKQRLASTRELQQRLEKARVGCSR
jgi:tetratricopeptide (TPR) repeat protein